MRFQEMKPDHDQLFTQWREHDRLEEQTCRPVADGQRLTPSGEVVTLVFFSDEVDHPVGKFTYFDVNPRNRSVEFGYVVSPQFRNRGIGTKMVAAAVSYLFSEVGLNKVYCQTAAFNSASVKLLEKLGFHRDAILRQHHELDGTFWDDFIYSKLRSEWLNQAASDP